MLLHNRTLSDLADMICGGTGSFFGSSARDEPHLFPYRSSSVLTEFFQNCDLDFRHDGSTRKSWVQTVLEKLHAAPSSNPHLPSDPLVRVIEELMDPTDFGKRGLDRSAALVELNKSIGRDGLQAYFDGAGRCYLRNLGTKTTSAGSRRATRAWTAEELTRRSAFEAYLSTASEDDFIEQVLVPLFQQLGFIRISVAGHKDKALEYGKDIWMKYQLPTSHFIYFGVQAKIGKLDASGRPLASNNNIAEIINQVHMALQHPIWDPETNLKCLLDHVFIVAAGEITKQAKNLVGDKLDQESRRHIIFMDKSDILDLALSTNLRLPASEAAADSSSNVDDDDIPF
jgi:hypothetical protein